MEDKMLKEINKQVNRNDNKYLVDDKIITKDTKYSFVFLKYFLPIILIIVLRINNFIKNIILFFVLLSVFIVIGIIGFYIEAMEIIRNRKNANK